MFDLEHLLGSKKSDDEPVMLELTPVVTAAINKIWLEMVAESKSNDENNDANHLIGKTITSLALYWKSEKEKEAERVKRESERLAREAKEREERERAPHSMPTERTRRGERAA